MLQAYICDQRFYASTCDRLCYSLTRNCSSHQCDIIWKVSVECFHSLLVALVYYKYL